MSTLRAAAYLALALGCWLLLCPVSSRADAFPSEEELAGASVGDLVLKPGVYAVGDDEYEADYGTLFALENRSRDGSRTIRLPIIRLRATGPDPAEPVFLLMGGPGASNLWPWPPTWLLEHHDIVMVGYRGFDGPSALDTPEMLPAITVTADANLRRFGEALLQAYERFDREGVDVDGYTMVDVVDDLEEAREQLGYSRINLYSLSYGTRVAYIYGLRHPASLRHSMMYAVNPPGGFVWEPEMVDRQLRKYAELWADDPETARRAPDLIASMRSVLAQLPKEVDGIRIEANKVRMISFVNCYHVGSAVMVLDAFVSADEGDWTSLAAMTMAYDQMMPWMFAGRWGEGMAKAASADFDPDRDYAAEMMPDDAIIGAPGSMMWGGVKYGGWPMRRIDEEYRQTRETAVSTLLVNGDLDFSTPVERVREMAPFFTNGRLVELKGFGHSGDVDGLQPEAFRHMVETFYLTGEVDDSKFVPQPVNLRPSSTIAEMMRQMMGQAD